MDRSLKRSVCATAVAIPVAQGISSAVIAGFMGLVALHADTQLRVPLNLKIEFPKLSLPNLPKVELPKVSLPKLGGKKSAAPAESASKAETASAGAKVQAVARTVNKNIKVRAAASAGTNKDAPSFEEVKGARFGTAVKADGYSAFPLRRMPGANMQSFLDMAKDMKTP
mmetsp:Transcript_496/g.895  ORF Transcript_496/g.895 Transcript_496/m.895 type:complete len:169 (-) Transcript_496:102-608(-)